MDRCDLTGNSRTETSVQVRDLFIENDRCRRIFDRRHQLFDDLFFILIFVIRFIERYLTGICSFHFLQELFKIELFGEFIIDNLQKLCFTDDLFN